MNKKTIAQHAVDVLLETDNPAVMWGDCGLLDMIADRAKVSKLNVWPPMWRWKQVLDGLEGSPLFRKVMTYAGNRPVRKFELVAAVQVSKREQNDSDNPQPTQ